MGPIVSVLIPTRNRPELLIKAVQSALAQTYHPIEIIVTDNSDTNHSGDLIALLNNDKIRYIKNPENIGPILNWRKALEIAIGEYCLVLPDDDYLINPFYINDAVKILQNREIQLVVTDCILNYPGKNIICTSGYSGLINGKEFIRRGLHIPHIGNIFRKEMAQHLDAFHSNDILWSDIELWMKLMSIGDVYCYSKPSTIYIFHNDNIVLNMNRTELITNSRFIRSSVESFADESLVTILAIRYLCMIDEISSELDAEFVRTVLKINGITKSAFIIMLKITYRRLKRSIKTMLLNFISKIKWLY